MDDRQSYGQYCPLSMASEILCTRWTTLVMRELLEGSEAFNEIHRGVPLMSRGLLSQRLKDLVAAGLATRTESGPGRPVAYRLTPAGQALGPVVRGLAEWGQEWIDTEPSLADADTDFLMWDIRRNVKILPDLPEPFVVQFHFPDGPEKKTLHWLVFSGGEVDLCYVDPGHEVDVYLEAGLRDMVRVWMGWTPLDRAIDEGRLLVDGAPALTTRIRDWLGLSSVSHVAKRPSPQRVLRAAE